MMETTVNEMSFEALVNDPVRRAEAEHRWEQARLKAEAAEADAALERFHAKMARNRRERLKIEVAKYILMSISFLLLTVVGLVRDVELLAWVSGGASVISAVITAYGIGLVSGRRWRR